MYKLKQTDRCLTFYNGTKVEPLGILNANVEFKRIVTNMNFYVFKNGGPPILGRDFLNIYNIGFSNLNFMNERINIKTNALINQFSNLFSEGVGLFNKSSLSLKLKNTNVTPKFHKARPIPYALKSPVEAEINRLLSLGIISPVDYSQWGTPVVPVLKKNGAVRLCGDNKVTINPHIEIDQHPLPRIQDLFGCLQGGVQFSKLDLSDAYQQVGLDDD
ncbi:uncharacterized protein K02A2.6-like [Coccinella septempunctata]|uniref:uncharacterized protein K02A2.6-like n=1 Tax=Coccinella septempunctata TaxID=41139 RepID=UPI001D086717|nr:uncharacterized protein K02A2.6-like [Coccinella septempunctata]